MQADLFGKQPKHQGTVAPNSPLRDGRFVSNSSTFALRETSFDAQIHLATAIQEREAAMQRLRRQHEDLERERIAAQKAAERIEAMMRANRMAFSLESISLRTLCTTRDAMRACTATVTRSERTA